MPDLLQQKKGVTQYSLNLAENSPFRMVSFRLADGKMRRQSTSYQQLNRHRSAATSEA